MLDMETNGIKNKPAMLLIMALAGLAWAGLIGMIFLYKVGSNDDSFWTPARVLTYVLLLVAPALTFIPIGKALGKGWYGWVAIVSFALLGYTLEFVPHTSGWNQNVVPMIAFLLGLFLAVYTISWPVFYLLGFRFFKRRVERYDLGRSQREAILLGLYIVTVLFLGAAKILNPTYAGALFLIFLSVELLFLTRKMRTR